MRYAIASRWWRGRPAAPGAGSPPPSARRVPPSSALDAAPGPALADPIYDRPETLEETAELVTALGGRGIAHRVDRLDAEQVRALADRLGSEHGRIDVLVNDIWVAEVLKGPPPKWGAALCGNTIWPTGYAQCGWTGDPSHHLARPTAVADRPAGRSLVEITDSTTEYNARTYRISVFYDLVKCAVNGWGSVQSRTRTGALRCHRGRREPGVAALGDDARRLRRHRSRLAYGTECRPRGRPPDGPARLRGVRDAAVRGPRRRSDRRRP